MFDERGKNQCVVFDVQKEREQKSSQLLMVRMSSALISDEFELVYQPKVNMVSGELVRVNHWVIEYVVQQLQNWRRIGFDFNLSANVSIKTLEEPGFSHWLARLLLRYP